MSTMAFDPYFAQSRLLWRNRVSEWRTRPGEAGFHALAWSCVVALLVGALVSQANQARQALNWLRVEYPFSALLALSALVLLDQQQARRRQRSTWSQDWLQAQPVALAVRRRHRRLLIGGRLAGVYVLAWPLLAWAGAGAGEVMVLSLGCAAAAGIGHALGDRERSGTQAPASRETLSTSTQHGSISRWQWIEAGAALAPRHLAPLLLVILLVPRGPAAMALLALFLLGLAAGTSGWLRAVGVIVQAERWLRSEPVQARTWLRQSYRLPLLALLAGGAVWITLALLNDALLLGLLVGVGLPMLGSLYLLVVASGRSQPQRVPLRMALHVCVLLACAQALPPLLPLVWLAQLWFLHRRSERQ
jgi:hypothetical protein